MREDEVPYAPDGTAGDIGVSQGDYEREERQALRRVQGLSTELEDVTEVEYRQVRLERVVLAGIWTDGTARDAERSLAELALLAETAGSVVLEGVIQRRDTPDPATYLGSGKVKELREIVAATGADTVICDGELTPGQLRQLEEIVKVKVVDELGEPHVALRVHERGVGETLSCGTGACAVAWAARRRPEPDLVVEPMWQVDVPRGTVNVTEAASGAMLLNGSADLVARGTVLLRL